MARSAKKFAKKRVTSHDVARELGVSATTVGLAMRDDARVAEKTKVRIRAMAKQMRYRQRAAASTLAGGRTHSVGLVFARTAGRRMESALGVHSSTVQAVIHLLAEHDYVVTLSDWQQPEHYEHKPTTKLPRVFRESGIEGALIIWPPVDDMLESTLQDAMLPYVVIDGPAAPGRWAVLVDERNGMEMAVEHLVKLGHRQISFFAMEPQSKHSVYNSPRHWEYQQGYISAMREAGLTPMPGREYSARSGKESYDDLIAKSFGLAQPPTALITYDDHEALAAMSRLMRRGLSIPEDVSVITLRDHYDVNEAIELISGMPQLTCKSNMQEQMATAAVNQLLSMIERDEPIAADHTPEAIAVKPELIVRKSAGPPPAAGK